MRVRESNWAAQVPWSGIQNKPAFADGPSGNITIPDVAGLTAALAGKVPVGSLARVATSGNYNDLNNRPVLGSAAFADASDFALASQSLRIPQVMARVFCHC